MKPLLLTISVLVITGCSVFGGTVIDTSKPDPGPRRAPQTAEQDMDRAYTGFQGAILGAKGKTQDELEDIFRIPMKDKGKHNGMAIKGWRQYGSVGAGDRAGTVTASSVLLGDMIHTTGTVNPGQPGWSKNFDCRVFFLFDDNGICVDAASEGDCFRVDSLSRTGLSVEIE